MWRLFALVAVTSMALLWWPDALTALRWQRGVSGDGQSWRMLSAHFAHLGPWHALANLAGMALVIELLGACIRPAEAVSLMMASALAIIGGLAMFSPAVGWYAGLSGVVHGWWAGFALLGWRRQQGRWQGQQQARRRDSLPPAALGVLVLKLLWLPAWWPVVQQWPGLSGAGILPVVPQSHVYGAIGGAAAALALIARSIARSSREAMQHQFGLE